MVKGIIYNYRTNKEGVAYFDSCFVGEEFQYYDNTNLIVDNIDVHYKDMSATIQAHSVDEKEQVDKGYVITQVNVHSVIDEIK